MSIGPLGPLPAAAGTPLAQTRGDLENSQVVRENQERKIAGNRQAEAAAGIGETDGEDHQTEERDADGRRPWEIPPPRKQEADSTEQKATPKDPQGTLGQLLDLSG